MALFTGDGRGTPLVDDTTVLAMRRRMSELAGLVLIALAGVLGVMLWSYHPDDPSLWNSTARAPQNALGISGAFVADPLMKFIGLAGWGLVTLLAIWGLRALVHRGIERVWGRLLVMPAAMLSLTIFLSTHGVGEDWPLSVGLGGISGDRGLRILLDALPMADAESLLAASLGLALLTAVLFGASLGMSLGEALALWHWLARSFRQVMGRFLVILGLGAVAGAKATGRGVAAGVKRYRDHRAEARSRAETLGPATPTGSWRHKMAQMPMPLVPALGERAGTAEISRDRVTGLEEDPSLAPRMAAGGRVRREPEPARMNGFDVPGDDDPGGERSVLRSAIRNLMDQGEPPSLDEGDALGAPLEQPQTSPQEPVSQMRDAPLREAALPGSTVSHPPHHAKAKSRRARAEAEPMLALDGLDEEAPYDAPPLDILARPIAIQRVQMSDIALEENARMLETVLEDYGVRGEIVAVKPGPVVTLYELEPAPGLKASRVIGLADDIARSMSALAARVSTVPGRSVIGIELPNAQREKVFLRETLEHSSYGDARYPLALALGKDIEGAPVVANLAKMPHLLIAGTTGSGKSVAINTMILSLLYRLSPQQCRLIMIDPKMLELSVYDNIPHLMAPVVTDPKKAVVALKWVVAEMEDRYRKMSKMGVRNIDGYNARVRDALEKGE
ncbi:MAG: DNA translocase FtsK 4TM domain-containing protein, partial [Pseudomonadota bacterium]